MPVNSRQKGAGYEREIAQLLRDHGFTEARRGQQYCGSSDSPDVLGIPGVHIECKRVKRLGRLYEWMAQSERESDVDEDPIVITRGNGGRSLVVMDAKDFLDLMAELIERREHGDSKGTPGVPEVGSEDHRRHDGEESRVDAPSVIRNAQSP